MNAGTAQRIALNLLSSLVMIRLGRVYAGLMVDVHATNAKLAGRRERMVAHLTGRDAGDVKEALLRAGGNVKLAVLILNGSSPEQARHILDASGGRLRDALALAGQPEQL
jgi:N-acetylmuramic acid 6-phosphate etherase